MNRFQEIESARIHRLPELIPEILKRLQIRALEKIDRQKTASIFGVFQRAFGGNITE
jgi:hypothetical protein